MAEPVIACTLDDAQLRARRAGLLAEVAARVEQRRETTGGWAFRFQASSDTLHLLARLIDAERQCCAFLTFALSVGAMGGPVWLEVEGPEGAKELVAGLWGELGAVEAPLS